MAPEMWILIAVLVLALVMIFRGLWRADAAGLFIMAALLALPVGMVMIWQLQE